MGCVDERGAVCRRVHGVDEHCAEHELAAETPVEGVPKLGAEDAQEGVQHARGEGGSIEGEAQNTLDLTGEDAGTLPFDLGANSIAHATLGSVALVLGTELGNGLDQLFEAPSWEPFSSGDEHELSEKHSELVSEKREGIAGREKIADNFGGDIESEPEYTEPPGYYVEDGHVGGGDGIYEYTEECETGNIFKECKGLHTIVNQNSEGYLPSGFTKLEHRQIETDYEGSHTVAIYRFGWKPFPECPSVKADSPGTVGARSTPEATACPPVGAPAPDLITPEIEGHKRRGRTPCQTARVRPCRLADKTTVIPG
jgi:hypothetical protein